MTAGQRPTLTDENVRAMWAAFDSVVAAPLRRAGIPLEFTVGNILGDSIELVDVRLLPERVDGVNGYPHASHIRP